MITNRQLSLMGSWSFMFGCLAFTYNSAIQTPISRSYFIGCMLFNAGCVFNTMVAYKLE